MVQIPNISHLDPKLQTAINNLVDHSNWLEKQVVALQGQVSAIPAPLTLEQIQQALSATGSHPLNLTGLIGTPGGP